jgi:hypothetical protein
MLLLPWADVLWQRGQTAKVGQLDQGTVIVFGSTGDLFGNLAGDAEGVHVEVSAPLPPNGNLSRGG